LICGGGKRETEHIKVQAVCWEKKVKNPCSRYHKITDEFDNLVEWLATDLRFNSRQLLILLLAIISR
jgi:hypothetical protein